MGEFTKKVLELKIISNVILSPRSGQAFYLKIDFKTEDLPERIQKDVNIIYPFYQYGTYEKYHSQGASYYLPGSSVKGILLSSNDNGKINPHHIMLDDGEINGKDIILDQLFKIQFLPQRLESLQNKGCDVIPKQTKSGIFFKNVAVEMLKSGATVSQEIRFDATCDINQLIVMADKHARNKLNQMLNYLNETRAKLNQDSERNNSEINKINEYQQKLENLLNDRKRKLLSIGGYKGLIRSLDAMIEADDKGAIYIDAYSGLPYGIAEVLLKDE